MDDSVKCCQEVKRDKPEKCSWKLVTGCLGKGSLGGGKDQSRPSGWGRERGSEDVETESVGVTILRSLMQRVVAEISKLEKDTEHREFFFF